MSVKFINDTYLKNIADAIRSKLGTSTTYTPSEMATAIESISSSGSGGGNGTPTTDWINAFLTQDNTSWNNTASSSEMGGIGPFTPNTQWTLKGYNATYSNSSSPSIYYFKDSDAYYEYYQSSYNSWETTQIFGTTLNYSDFSTSSNALPKFTFYTYSMNLIASYRVRPMIYVPTDYTVTNNTKIDVRSYLVTQNSNSTYKIKVYFKYRLYEPVNMSSKTYKNESGNTLANVTSVSLNKNTTSLLEGATETLTATVLPSNAITTELDWTSSNNSVVTVSNGVLTAQEVGSATVTATSIVDSSKIASCSVTVASELTADWVNPTFSITSGMPYAGYWTENQTTKVAFKVYDTNTYTQTDSPYTGTVYLYKSGNYTSIQTLSNSSSWVDISSNNTGDFLVASSYDQYGMSAYQANFTIPTSATGLKIKYYNGFLYVKYTTSISGTVAVTGVSLSPSTANVSVGATTTLTATVTPDNATDKSLTWSSSDTTKATVSDGVVTGVAAGNVTITATSVSNSSVSGSSTITVASSSSGGGSTSDSWAGVTYTYSSSSVSDSNGELTYTGPMAGYWKPYIDGSYYTPTDEFQIVNREISGNVTYFDPDDGISVTGSFSGTGSQLRFKYVDSNSKRLLIETK